VLRESPGDESVLNTIMDVIGTSAVAHDGGHIAGGDGVDVQAALRELHRHAPPLSRRSPCPHIGGKNRGAPVFIALAQACNGGIR
jgi:hypothetical protein